MRFKLRLHLEIDGILASHQFTTYSRVVQTAQAISNILEIDQTFKQCAKPSGKQKWNGSNKEKWNGKNKKINIGSSFGQTVSLSPKCNKTHKGKCLFGNNVCYRCGKQIILLKTEKKPSRRKITSKKRKGIAKLLL